MLEQCPIFDTLAKEYLALLAGPARRICAEKGSILFWRGDAAQGFHAPLEGVVHVCRVPTRGMEITRRIIDAGSTFAEASIFSNTNRCNAETSQNSWIRTLSRKILNLYHRIEAFSLKSSRERIANYLPLLSKRQKASFVKLPAHPKSIAIQLGMTHDTFLKAQMVFEQERRLR